MGFQEYGSYDALGLADLVRRGEASPAELLDEAFAPVFEAAPFTMVANVTGQPSMSLPLHWTEDGLPMGMLFTARIGDEAVLLRLAAQLEMEMPWSARRPPHAALARQSC